MCEFKAGDRVKLKSGKKFYNGEYTNVIRKIFGVVVYFEDSTNCHINLLELTHQKPPHKHRDMIIAWANGADIQVSNYAGWWIDVPIPNWSDMSEYRIKPQKSERDIEIESIQKQMDELKERLERLKGEES